MAKSGDDALCVVHGAFAKRIRYIDVDDSKKTRTLTTPDNRVAVLEYV